MNTVKILLVEDEKKIATALKDGLSERGFDVMVANDGLSGEELFLLTKPDLVILDINLPGKNGYELSQQIRKKNAYLPILMLTALDSTDDKVYGFDSGADDYMVKPFAFKELTARINSLLRRSTQKISQRVVQVADLVADFDSKTVTRSGKNIQLTAKEFQLLEFLINNKNKVVSRADIASQVWDIKFDTGTNVIDVYINFLRKKIDKDFPDKLIHTHVGMGYILKDFSAG